MRVRQRSVSCAIVLAGGLLAGFMGRAAAGAMEGCAAEPSVDEVQRAALAEAELHPEQVAAWQSRIRAAALAPTLHVGMSLGSGVQQTTSASDGVERYAAGGGNTWLINVSASWQLDRLVFSREELRLANELQRLALRKEDVLSHITQLYFQRRRLQMALGKARADGADDAEIRMQIDELSALINGLTGGVLRRTRAHKP